MKLASIVVGTSAFLAAMCAAASGRVNIVSENQAGQSWTLAPDAPRVVAGYPGAAGDKSQDVCVNIGYLIDKDGKTSNFVQLKAWSSSAPKGEPAQEAVQPFVQSAAAAVSMWRFVPAGKKPSSIYTSASFAFAGSKALPEEEIRARCRIDDLAGMVARAKAQSDLASRSKMEGQRSTTERMGSGY